MTADCTLFLHVGPPRTATTTLQKYFFTSTEHYLCLQKRAYRAHNAAAQDEGLQVSNGGYIVDYNDFVSRLEALQDRGLASAGERDLLFLIVKEVAGILCSQQLQGRRRWQQLLTQALGLAARVVVCGSKYRGVMIASESLSNTPLAITGKLSKVYDRITLPTKVICDAWKVNDLGLLPCISFCLRDPEEYVLSRYMRYSVNKMMRGEGHTALSPEEWLTVQVQGHKLKPWSSALFPAYHKSYIRYHSKYGFVRPYGFRELLASEDVFDLIGLAGERKVAFSAFPKENSFPTLMEVACDARARICGMLSNLQILSQLHEEQLFE